MRATFRHIRVIAVGAVAALFVPLSATAFTITFDDVVAPCLFNQTVPLTEQYAGLGIHFSGPGTGRGGAILNACSSFGVAARSGDNFLAFNHAAHYAGGEPATGMETIWFDALQSTVSLYASGGTQSSTFTLGAWDTTGGYLGGAMATAPAGAYALLSVTSPVANIYRVVFATTADPTYVLDDLTFDPSVPEPSTALLLLVGAAGVLGRRVRRVHG